MNQIWQIDALVTLLLVLVNVAFITLLERKVLSYSQIRVGPNKPSILGILQPMSDAVKLFSNNSVVPYLKNVLFDYMPFLSLTLVLILWTLIPSFSFSSSFSFSAITLLAIMSMTVYPVMLAGWASNSKYSELGSLRNIAQTISYEVSFALVLALMLFNMGMLSLSEVSLSLLNLVVWPFLMVVWLIVVVAETNRTPFDFSEGESELVSGFNTEYSSNKFAVIFMAEYASIYFLSVLTSFLFLSNVSYLIPFMSGLLVFWWIWLRATLPRHRYDSLMILNWKSLLPLTLLILTSSMIFYSL